MESVCVVMGYHWVDDEKEAAMRFECVLLSVSVAAGCDAIESSAVKYDATEHNS